MNLARIRQRASGGGFRPFAMRTSDGREYVIRHPKMVLVAPRSLAVVDRDGEIVTLNALQCQLLRCAGPDPLARLHHCRSQLPNQILAEASSINLRRSIKSSSGSPGRAVSTATFHSHAPMSCGSLNSTGWLAAGMVLNLILYFV